MAKDLCKLNVTKCPTYGEFFERSMKGMHKRMGEISKPDRALALYVMKEMFGLLEREWENPHTNKFRLAREGAFYLITYCCAEESKWLTCMALGSTGRPGKNMS
jgi:hypothetical protein